MSFMKCDAIRQTLYRRRTLAVVLMAMCLPLVACSDDTAPGMGMSSGAQVRVINSLYQEVPGGTPVARAIDHLFDSSILSPSVLNLAPNGISTTSEAAAGYRPIARGVRNFVARLAGGSPPNGTLYSTQGNVPYLPRLYLDPGRYFTVVVAGIIPAAGNVPYGALPFVLIPDDHFPGPVVNGVTQARFNVINAAPFNFGMSTGRDVQVYVIPGTTVPPDPINTYASQGTARYRAGSPYVNVNPGSYVITLMGDGIILAQQVVAFSAGEVNTLILQNSSAAGSGTSNHKLTVVRNR